jgi:hypothetical protein
MKPKYTAEYFYNKFLSIPDEKWCVGVLTDELGRHCAIGHCQDRRIPPVRASKKQIALMEILHGKASLVNDGDDKYFTDIFPSQLGDTPKERILNAIVLYSSGIMEDV